MRQHANSHGWDEAISPTIKSSSRLIAWNAIEIGKQLESLIISRCGERKKSDKQFHIAPSSVAINKIPFMCSDNTTHPLTWTFGFRLIPYCVHQCVAIFLSHSRLHFTWCTNSSALRIANTHTFINGNDDLTQKAINTHTHHHLFTVVHLSFGCCLAFAH